MSTESAPEPKIIVPSQRSSLREAPRSPSPRHSYYRSSSPRRRSPDRYDRRRRTHHGSSPPRRRSRYDDRPPHEEASDAERPFSFKQYSKIHPQKSAYDLQKDYEEYVAKYHEKWNREYFDSHKDDSQFRKQFHPLEQDDNSVEQSALNVLTQTLAVPYEAAAPDGTLPMEQDRRVRCGITECRKLFKSVEFLETHFKRRHPEVIEEEKSKLEKDHAEEFYDNFLQSADRPRPPSPQQSPPSPVRYERSRRQPHAGSSSESDPRTKVGPVVYGNFPDFAEKYKDKDAPKRVDFSDIDYGL
ncbi:hypothetical protein RCL1_005015 [Eukaryota sp. TZLM3-RCL]